MTEKRDNIRVLALALPEVQGQIRRQLEPLGITIDFISQPSQLSHLVGDQNCYHVALLPAALPDTGWWALWGHIVFLTPQPEVLVYAHNASFQLWSGVLELGGYDVIVEPFTDEELQQAVLHAARSFRDRRATEFENE